MVKVLGPFETSVIMYQSAQHNIPEVLNFQTVATLLLSWQPATGARHEPTEIRAHHSLYLEDSL